MTTGQGRRFNPFRLVVRHLRTTLGAGILVMLPIGVTILIFKFFFNLLDPLLRPVVNWIPGLDTCASLTEPGTTCPGLGLIFLLILVYLVGLVMAHVVGRRVVEIGHAVMEAIPVVKSIYGTARSATELFSKPKDQPYRGVVLVHFPSRGLKSIGLVTAQLGKENGEEMLAVYVPSSPVPSTGFLVVVAAKDVIPTQMSVDDALKALISGGILTRDLYVPTASPTGTSASDDRVAVDRVN